MRALPLAAAALIAGPVAAAETAPDYRPLQLYQGSWEATQTQPPADKPIRIDNACGRIGTAFGCQQTVDGKLGGLVIYMPGDGSGRWKVQFVALDGHSGGAAGDLTIENATWTYLNRDKDEKGGETLTRNVNRFSGPDQIAFEISVSHDGGKTWKTTLAGHEARVKAP